MKEILSRQNAKFKIWLSLLESKGIKSEKLCIVSGAKLVSEFVRDQAHQVVDVLFPPKSANPFSESAVNAFRLAGDLFNELDIMGTKSPLAIVHAPQISQWSGTSDKGVHVIAALSDPQNLGALIRSAEAFQIASVILTKECASPLLPRSIRASSGAVFRVPLVRGPALRELELTKAHGLDMSGQSIYDVTWPRDLILVLGEEGRGLPESIKLTRVKIPMAPHMESLNATIAASIALYSYRQQFPLGT